MTSFFQQIVSKSAGTCLAACLMHVKLNKLRINYVRIIIIACVAECGVGGWVSYFYTELFNFSSSAISFCNNVSQREKKKTIKSDIALFKHH